MQRSERNGRARALADSLRHIAAALDAHANHSGPDADLWLTSMERHPVREPATQLAANLRLKETSRARRTTFARGGDAEERTFVRDTMGYHPDLVTAANELYEE